MSIYLRGMAGVAEGVMYNSFFHRSSNTCWFFSPSPFEQDLGRFVKNYFSHCPCPLHSTFLASLSMRTHFINSLGTLNALLKNYHFTTSSKYHSTPNTPLPQMHLSSSHPSSLHHHHLLLLLFLLSLSPPPAPLIRIRRSSTTTTGGSSSNGTTNATTSPYYNFFCRIRPHFHDLVSRKRTTRLPVSRHPRVCATG